MLIYKYPSTRPLVPQESYPLLIHFYFCLATFPVMVSTCMEYEDFVDKILQLLINIDRVS